MEKIYFSLELRDTNRFTRTIQIAFGIVCIAIAGYWLVYNINLSSADWKLWITVAFLTLFGIYQIATGAGWAARFFELSGDKMRLKKSSLLPVITATASEIKKIEIFPLNIIFHREKGRIMFRLGVTELEKAEMIKESVELFAARYNISCELKAEE